VVGEGKVPPPEDENVNTVPTPPVTVWVRVVVEVPEAAVGVTV
jgi:hypothetical protein